MELGQNENPPLSPAEHGFDLQHIHIYIDSARKEWGCMPSRSGKTTRPHHFVLDPEAPNILAPGFKQRVNLSY